MPEGTGNYIAVDPKELKERIPKFKGEHFWVISVTYKFDPETTDASSFIADHENAVSVMGPGCYHCVMYYTPEVASQKCRGDDESAF
jgi:hypothetical protein